MKAETLSMVHVEQLAEGANPKYIEGLREWDYEEVITELARDNLAAERAMKLANQAVLVASEAIQKLVTENAALKELIEQHAAGFGVCENCSHEEPCETDDIVALYRSTETPATDAAIAEIKAQGVDIYKAKCLQSIERTKLTLNPEHRELAEQMLLGIIDGCDVVAKELREGTLPEKFTANLRAGRKG